MLIYERKLSTERWGSETQATHCSEGEAGHNVLMEGKMGDTQRSPTISTKLHQIAEQAREHPDRIFTSLTHDRFAAHGKPPALSVSQSESLEL